MNPIRKLTYFFPYPARMAYWSYKSPFFSKELALLEEIWSPLNNLRNIIAEIKEVVLNKDFDELQEYSAEIKEEIKDKEEKLCLIPTVLLLGLGLLEVVKPSMIRIVVASAPQLVNLLNFLLLIINVLGIVAVVGFFNVTYISLFFQDLHLFYIERRLIGQLRSDVK